MSDYYSFYSGDFYALILTGVGRSVGFVDRAVGFWAVETGF